MNSLNSSYVLWDADMTEIKVSCYGLNVGAINLKNGLIVFVSENTILTSDCMLRIVAFMQSLEKDIQSIESWEGFAEKSFSKPFALKQNLL